MAKLNQPVRDSFSDPAVGLEAITPSDTTEYTDIRALRVNTAGTVTILAIDDTVAVPHPVLAGEVINCRIKKVMETGTDATGFIGYR